MSKHDLVFYENRSTGQVVEKGKKKPAKTGYGKQTSKRAATPTEEKQIAKGEWVRTRESGKKASDPGAKSSSLKGRPKLKKKK